MSINLKGSAPVSYHFVAVTCAAGLLIPASGVFIGQNAVDAWSIPGW